MRRCARKSPPPDSCTLCKTQIFPQECVILIVATKSLELKIFMNTERCKFCSAQKLCTNLFCCFVNETHCVAVLVKWEWRKTCFMVYLFILLLLFWPLPHCVCCLSMLLIFLLHFLILWMRTQHLVSWENRELIWRERVGGMVEGCVLLRFLVFPPPILCEKGHNVSVKFFSIF